jgi:hypothetical protein
MYALKMVNVWLKHMETIKIIYTFMSAFVGITCMNESHESDSQIVSSFGINEISNLNSSFYSVNFQFLKMTCKVILKLRHLCVH